MRAGPGPGSDTARPAEPVQQELRVAAVEGEVRDTQLLLGFHVPGAHSPDVGALGLAAALLGQGDGARLQVEARRNRQAVSEAYAYSYTPRDPVHDNYISAAYVLDKLKGSEGQLQGMSYWTYSDIFYESGPPPSAFHGGFGLMTIDGIQKYTVDGKLLWDFGHRGPYPQPGQPAPPARQNNQDTDVLPNGMFFFDLDADKPSSCLF